MAASCRSFTQEVRSRGLQFRDAASQSEGGGLLGSGFFRIVDPMALLDPGGKSACGLCMLCATQVPTFVIFCCFFLSRIFINCVNLPYFFVITSERSESPIRSSNHPLYVQVPQQEQSWDFHPQTSPNIFISERLDQSNARCTLVCYIR